MKYYIMMIEFEVPEPIRADDVKRNIDARIKKVESEYYNWDFVSKIDKSAKVRFDRAKGKK